MIFGAIAYVYRPTADIPYGISKDSVLAASVTTTGTPKNADTPVEIIYEQPMLIINAKTKGHDLLTIHVPPQHLKDSDIISFDLTAIDPNSCRISAENGSSVWTPVAPLAAQDLGAMRVGNGFSLTVEKVYRIDEPAYQIPKNMRGGELDLQCTALLEPLDLNSSRRLLSAESAPTHALGEAESDTRFTTVARVVIPGGENFEIDTSDRFQNDGAFIYKHGGPERVDFEWTEIARAGEENVHAFYLGIAIAAIVGCLLEALKLHLT